MHLLDEMGLEEACYAAAGTRITGALLEFDGYFKAHMTLPEVLGRRYAFGIDRGAFDHALWTHLRRYPSVTAREGVAVTDLARDAGGRVTGVVAAEKGGAREVILARLCVVGADGRHSLVARKVSARIVEDCSERTSTVYCGEWEGLRPATADGNPVIHVATRGRGQGVLFFPSAAGRVHIATHARSDRVEIRGDAHGYYMGAFVGLKRVANRYVEHGGPGWVLVGDALHHKDPVDGQGIYDALIEGKRLAAILLDVHEGRLRWADALAAYRGAVDEETHAMFLATMKRIEKELYDEPPENVIRTYLRWLLCDPEYQRRFFLFLGRSLPPDRWLPPSVMLAAAARGAARDLGRLLRRDRAA
jgi:2-polyprenyl-6-methoxyphenol hydroxylase-like FAD-dependent oxidoreductase